MRSLGQWVFLVVVALVVAWPGRAEAVRVLPLAEAIAGGGIAGTGAGASAVFPIGFIGIVGGVRLDRHVALGVDTRLSLPSLPGDLRGPGELLGWVELRPVVVPRARLSLRLALGHGRRGRLAVEPFRVDGADVGPQPLGEVSLGALFPLGSVHVGPAIEVAGQFVRVGRRGVLLDGTVEEDEPSTVWLLQQVVAGVRSEAVFHRYFAICWSVLMGTVGSQSGPELGVRVVFGLRFDPGLGTAMWEE